MTTAAGRHHSRALLVYDERENVEVLCDRRAVLSGGGRAEQHLKLVTRAWRSLLSILLPVFTVMLATLYFMVVNTPVTPQGGSSDGAPAPGADGGGIGSAVASAKRDTLSPEMALVVIAVVIVIFAVVALLAYRYREACERCFRRFLVADLLMVFMVGGVFVMSDVLVRLGATVDILTGAFCAWNFGVCGVYALYKPVPQAVHHLFIIVLNCIMSIMMVLILPAWLIFIVVGAAAALDVASEHRPQYRGLSPFLSP
jgi:hypothetical protein